MGEARTVEPRFAGVVVPLRQGPAGLEVLLLRRGAGARFMPGTYVFPGGRVEPDDGDVPVRGGVVGDGEPLFAVAAGRELFEEAGIFLGAPALPLEVRDRLAAREERFAATCRAFGTALDLRDLRPWSTWVTPEDEPLRFHTRFFLAPLPAGTVALHDDREMVESIWIGPREALDRSAVGELPLSPPVFRTLEELAPCASVETAMELSDGRDLWPLLPRRLAIPGGMIFILPGDATYPSAHPSSGLPRIRWDGRQFRSEPDPTVVTDRRVPAGPDGVGTP